MGDYIPLRPGMKFLICGGRQFQDKEMLYKVMSMVQHAVGLVINGGATGADELSTQWANEHEIPVQVFPAKWRQYGLQAGFIRNQQMLDEGKPDVVVAFPGERGTEMMVSISIKQGFPVIRGDALIDSNNKGTIIWP